MVIFHTKFKMFMLWQLVNVQLAVQWSTYFYRVHLSKNYENIILKFVLLFTAFVRTGNIYIAYCSPGLKHVLYLNQHVVLKCSIKRFCFGLTHHQLTFPKQKAFFFVRNDVCTQYAIDIDVNKFLIMSKLNINWLISL